MAWGVGITTGWGETEVFMEVSSRRLATVQHRHLPARGLLSLISLLRAFPLTGINRNQSLQPFGMENFARPAFHETMPVAAARWLPSSARRTHARPSLRNHDPLPTALAIIISISLSLTQSTKFLSVPLLCRPFLPTRGLLSLPQAALSLPPSSTWRPVAPAESDLHASAPLPRTHHGHRPRRTS